MARCKTRKFADGGMAEEEIVVEGLRPQNVGFDLGRMSGGGGGPMGPMMPGGGGGGASAPMGPREPAPRGRGVPPIARTAGYLGPTVGDESGRVSFGMGRRGAIGAGAAIPFKKGGAVKAKATKSSKASSRGDGIAKKGKTKGRFV